MPNTKHHDPTLPVEDASIFIATCLPFFSSFSYCRQPHIHCDTRSLMHLTQTLKKNCLDSHRHLHQHQQSFVTLNSPSLFYAAPQIRCIPQITYPELEAEEPRAFHKRRQLAEPLIYYFIYLFTFLSAIMRKLIQTSCINSPVCFHLVFCVSSVHLSPPHRMLLCSLQALPTLYSQIHTPYSHSHLIYPHLLPLN